MNRISTYLSMSSLLRIKSIYDYTVTVSQGDRRGRQSYSRLMLAVGYKLDVYSLKFEHKLGNWPVCQLTFIDV